MIGYDTGKARIIESIHPPKRAQYLLIAIDDVRGVGISGMLADDLVKPLVDHGDRVVIQVARRYLKSIFCLRQQVDHRCIRTLGGTPREE